MWDSTSDVSAFWYFFLMLIFGTFVGIKEKTVGLLLFK